VKTVPTPRRDPKGGLARWQVNRTVAYIEANLGSRLAMRELADLLTFSRSHFCRAFRRTLGVTPTAFVVHRRIERAKAMMLSTSEQLNEIALACGFADQPHMTRWFRRVVGTAPGLWRRDESSAWGKERRQIDVDPKPVE
jgi:AraC family transcriptional regulator